MKPGDLVRISYAGKPYHPGRTGWSMDDDQGYPGDDGKLAINLYDEPRETTSGTFWTVLIGGAKKKSICEAYLEVIDEAR